MDSIFLSATAVSLVCWAPFLMLLLTWRRQLSRRASGHPPYRPRSRNSRGDIPVSRRKISPK
jgi:hypothetical protein